MVASAAVGFSQGKHSVSSHNTIISYPFRAPYCTTVCPTSSWWHGSFLWIERHSGCSPELQKGIYKTLLKEEIETVPVFSWELRNSLFNPDPLGIFMIFVVFCGCWTFSFIHRSLFGGHLTFSSRCWGPHRNPNISWGAFLDCTQF